MKKFFLSLCLASSVIFISAHHPLNSPNTLYKSLKKNSVSQHFAFYELFPHTAEGKMALSHAFFLMHHEEKMDLPHLLLPTPDISGLISLITQPPENSLIDLDEGSLAFIEKLGKNLANRKLKTFGSFEEKVFLDADPSEVDLARALFVAQMELTEANIKKIRSYEALLDLMALQILAKIPLEASNEAKIAAINEFIFFEQHYCFPPHSQYAKEIDTYTFLSSVIEKRQGVCLGVTILYMSIAQRIDLPLQAITPPGHILPQLVKENNEVHNIETTARGLSFPTEMYLGVETKSIPVRNHKEVVGLAFMNQASVFWTKKEFKKAVELYEKASLYVPHDPLLKELLAYNYLFLGKKSKGKKLLKESLSIENPHQVGSNTIAEDYLHQKIDAEGILTIFIPVDEKRESILDKQKELQKVVARFPKFRAGHFQLANTYLQLGRDKEALNTLLTCYAIDADEATVNYYLSALFLERLDYQSAWKHLLKAEELAKKNDHHPKALKELRYALNMKAPPPSPL